MTRLNPDRSVSGAALRIDQLRQGFGGTEILRLDDLQITAGELLSVVGPSGCGKSTLLRVLAGLLPPTSGRVEISAAGGDEQGPTGFVFQDATLLPWRSAAANIRLPGELEGRPISNPRVAELADLVGLTAVDLLKRPPALSGGMKMRVSLARALALQPRLLLLDEPFAALDDLLRQQLQSDVRGIQQALGITTVLVTHNVSEAVFMSDRVWTLGGTPAGLTAEIPIDLDRDESTRGTMLFAQYADRVLTALRTTEAMRCASN